MSPAKSNRGRPIVHTEPWAKITVVLLDRHVAYLDRLAIDIRLRHGKAISRAELIRGLIEAAFQSGLDLSQADSMDTLVDLLVATPRPRKTSLRSLRVRRLSRCRWRISRAAIRVSSSSLEAPVRSMPESSNRSSCVRMTCAPAKAIGMSGLTSFARRPR